MTSERSKPEEEEYDSSSDEDYDPTKDTEIDPQDEIDDTEGGEEEVGEDVEKLSKESKDDRTEETLLKTHTVDVDAIFAELTGLPPSSYGSTSSTSKNVTKSEPEEKCFPESSIPTASAPSDHVKVYPKKLQTPATEVVKTQGTKRVGVLEAAKALSKRSKMSVLDRSDQDWKDFTAQNNLKEDLESHNRGKGGYLNKMEFLNRADNRQFEKERAFRATARKDTGA